MHVNVWILNNDSLFSPGYAFSDNHRDKQNLNQTVFT